jgi:hypothetical protein
MYTLSLPAAARTLAPRALAPGRADAATYPRKTTRETRQSREHARERTNITISAPIAPSPRVAPAPPRVSPRVLARTISTLSRETSRVAARSSRAASRVRVGASRARTFTVVIVVVVIVVVIIIVVGGVVV